MISTARDLANFLVMQNNAGRFSGRVLLSQGGVTRMHTPPAGIDSPYAMGWMATAPGVVEHNGVLSTFHADATLLPDDGYGVVVLSNSYNALAGYDAIMQGLVDLVTRGATGSGGMGARTLGLVLAVLTAVTAGLYVLGLRSAGTWARRRRDTPWPLVVVRLALTTLPAVLLAVFPQVLASTLGRVFSFRALYRAMPGVMIWLTLSALLGVALGVARARALASHGFADGRAHPATSE